MKSRGFTLIELLVVISIIGVLSSIVLASLNTARAKGVQASIKSNMRNMISAAELSYDAASPNSYVNACTAVVSMITAINNIGGAAQCWSFSSARWGVSAKLNSDSTKNYSVDSSAVVSWDSKGVNSSGVFVSPDVVMNWDTAVAACAASGGRLPTIDQLNTLYLVYGSVPPPSFQASNYWSGTEDPANSANALGIPYGGSGIVSSYTKATGGYVRCVR